MERSPWLANKTMWKPTTRRNRRALQGLIQDLTNNGELVVEFAVRVLLGQDLRLARDWVPLIRAANGIKRPRGTKMPTKADGQSRLNQVRKALAAMPDPPEITMDDRRWAAQFLMAYGWGLPSRSSPTPEPPGESALAVRAAEVLNEFQPNGAEEEARLARIMAAIDGRPIPLAQDASGTYREVV